VCFSSEIGFRGVLFIYSLAMFLFIITILLFWIILCRQRKILVLLRGLSKEYRGFQVKPVPKPGFTSHEDLKIRKGR